MDKLVGRDEMLDAVTGFPLHIIEFIASDSHLCRYRRRLRHEHEGPSDALGLPDDELRLAVHVPAGEILYLEVLAEGRVGEIARAGVELHVGAAVPVRLRLGRVCRRGHRDAEPVGLGEMVEGLERVVERAAPRLAQGGRNEDGELFGIAVLDAVFPWHRHRRSSCARDSQYSSRHCGKRFWQKATGTRVRCCAGQMPFAPKARYA